jgi:tetratricopeptide (TPR) repeat protein
MTASNSFLPPTMPAGRTREHEALQQALIALDSGRVQEAERIAGEVLKVQPRQPRALYVLGCARIMQDRAADAIAPLEAAVHGRHDAEIETMLAIALRQAGRQEDALRRLKLAVKRRPPYAPAFKELGYLLVLMEHYDEAVEVLNRGIEIAPMMPQLSIQLGYAHISRRDNASAKIAFARALEISPRSHDALFGMAKAHQEIGECDAAADYFRRSLTIEPDDQAAWLHLGHCLLELGQADAGNDCFRIAARGDKKQYGNALSSFVAAGRGRFWLKPSAAMRFFRRDVASASAPGTDGDKRPSRA